MIPGSGQNGSQGQQGQKIYTTGNPQQRIIRSTNQQPIQRIVPPGTRLVASNQVGGSSGRPQGQQIVYRAQPSGDRSQVRGPGKNKNKITMKKYEFRGSNTGHFEQTCFRSTNKQRQTYKCEF